MRLLPPSSSNIFSRKSINEETAYEERPLHDSRRVVLQCIDTCTTELWPQTSFMEAIATVAAEGGKDVHMWLDQ